MLQLLILVFATFGCFSYGIAQNDSIKHKWEQEIDIAYGKRLSINNTAAISSVSGNDLNMPVSSLSNALSGKIAGLTTYLNSGEPGNDAATLFIRGRSSYNYNNILVYVDGFQSSFEHLSAMEVESVSVLKDAAALAQFGIEGANGVLWVTTKRGKGGKTKVNFQTRYVSAQPTEKLSFLDSYNYARLYNEANSNDKGVWSPVYTNDELQKYKNGSDPVLYPNINWYDEITKSQVPFYDANLSFSGGNSIVLYAVNLGYQNSDLIYKDNPSGAGAMKNIGNFRKYNFRANADVKINRIFSVSADLGGAISEFILPNYTSGSLWNNIYAYPSNIYPVKNPTGTWGGNSVYTDNPVASIFATGQNTFHKRIVQANVKLSQNMDFLIKGLTLTEAFSFVDYFEGYYNKQKNYLREQPYLNNGEIAYLTYGENTDYVVTDGTSDVWQRPSFYVSADYANSFGEHTISGRLAFKQDRYLIDGRNAPYFKQGLYGFLNYSYEEKYIAEFGYSYSASENFMSGHRWGFFPTLSGAWVLSKENLMTDIQWIDLFKLRLSAGVVGNDNIGRRFLYQSYYAGNAANSYILGTSAQTSRNYLAEYIVGNPNVTWEKSHKFNIGFDMAFWKNLNITVDAFYDKRTDILSQKNATVPTVYGNVLPYENVGEVSNSGIELEIGYHNRIGDLHYNLNGMLSFARNVIDYQEEPIRTEDYLYRTGHQIGQPFGLEYLGFYELKDFDSDGNLVSEMALPSFPVQPGDLKYKDQNNDGFINDDDQIAIGYNSLPELIYSFNIDLKYKGFDLNAFFQGAANRSVYLNGVYAWAFVDNTNAPKMAEGRWAYYPDQGIDTRATATYPRLSTESNGNNYTQSTFWMKNGNYLRLKNLEIGYTIPSKISQKIHMGACRFFAGGSNLLTVDKITDYDPELIGGYPLMKNYYVGINVGF